MMLADGCSLLQDTEVQWRRGNVTITQAVPRANWFLIPSPAIKVPPQPTAMNQVLYPQHA